MNSTVSPNKNNYPMLIALACAVSAIVLGGSGASAQADDLPVAPAPTCEKPCYVVKDYWPVKQCKEECSPEICTRGWGAWNSEEVCCAPGVAFPEGCGEKLKNCWVVENHALETCRQDQRKCLQGYSVWPTKESCCIGAFQKECAVLPVLNTTCWVVDTYFPARLCRESNTLCGSEAKNAGVQSWGSKKECCTKGAAFQEGCSSRGPPVPCWVVDSYDPVRRCREEPDLAACNRGWGVYESQDICCAPNVAFPEGCSELVAPAVPQGAATPSAAGVTPAAPVAPTPAAPAAATPTPAAPATATPTPAAPAAATPTPAAAPAPAAATPAPAAAAPTPIPGAAAAPTPIPGAAAAATPIPGAAAAATPPPAAPATATPTPAAPAAPPADGTPGKPAPAAAAAAATPTPPAAAGPVPAAPAMPPMVVQEPAAPPTALAKDPAAAATPPAAATGATPASVPATPPSAAAGPAGNAEIPINLAPPPAGADAVTGKPAPGTNLAPPPAGADAVTGEPAPGTPAVAASGR